MSLYGPVSAMLRTEPCADLRGVLVVVAADGAEPRFVARIRLAIPGGDIRERGGEGHVGAPQLVERLFPRLPAPLIHRRRVECLDIVGTALRAPAVQLAEMALTLPIPR